MQRLRELMVTEGTSKVELEQKFVKAAEWGMVIQLSEIAKLLQQQKGLVPELIQTANAAAIKAQQSKSQQYLAKMLPPAKRATTAPGIEEKTPSHLETKEAKTTPAKTYRSDLHELSEVLLELEEGQLRSSQALKKDSFKRLAYFYLQTDPEVDAKEFQKHLMDISKARFASLTPDQAFLIGVMHFIGLSLPELSFKKDLVKAYDYFKYAFDRMNSEKFAHPHLGSCFYMARIHSETITSSSPWVKQQDLIKNYYETAAQSIPASYTFLARFYETLAHIQPLQRKKHLANAEQTYQLATKEGCYFAPHHLEVLAKEGGIYLLKTNSDPESRGAAASRYTLLQRSNGIFTTKLISTLNPTPEQTHHGKFTQRQ